MGSIKTCVLLISVLLSCCEAYKLLLVFPIGSKSHKHLGDGFVRHLLNDGHEVTYITAYEYKNPPPGLRVIEVPECSELMDDKAFNMETLMKSGMSLDIVLGSLDKIHKIPVKTYENKDVQKLLSDPNEHFDAVIVEWMLADLLAGFAAILDAPLIWSTSTEVSAQGLSLLNHPTNPSYFPGVASGNSPPYTFGQRIIELTLKTIMKIATVVYFDRHQESNYDRLVAPLIAKRGRKPPTYYEVKMNGSLILGNTHTALGQATTLPPNYVHIGGYHINEDVKPLPENLQKIMDSAKHGVIYFSMGSILKSTDISDEMKSELLDTFSKLKQTVFWKLEKPLPNLPKNVHVLEWAPQPSILSHPNCVLFITHGGLLSTIEAIHFGVPTIGIPVYGDQYINVKRMVSKGYGKKVDLTTSLARDLLNAIEDILNDKRYSEKAKELSVLNHDRPVKPGAELVHWVMHVVRTRGATHLRPAEQLIPLYQQYYLDLVVILVSIVLLLKFTFSKIFRKKVDHKKKNN